MLVELAERMPPAVEIARAIGAMPVRRTGTALMSRARSAGARVASVPLVASCSRPISAG